MTGSGNQPGRAWCVGDRIDTDVLAPGWAMKLDPDALASHCLEAVKPGFSQAVQPGDILFAGADFGIGSSREQAAISLKRLGVAVVVAPSFARIFYRNALNIGLLALIAADPPPVSEGDKVRVDPRLGVGENVSTGKHFTLSAIPDHLMDMIEAGGLMAHLKTRLARAHVGDT